MNMLALLFTLRPDVYILTVQLQQSAEIKSKKKIAELKTNSCDTDLIKARQAYKLQSQSNILQNFVYGALSVIVTCQSCLNASKGQLGSLFGS